MEGMCKCWGFKKILLGVLILLNAFVWPLWSGVDGWVAFFGVLMVIAGLVKLVYPKGCSCNQSAVVAKKKK
ncbi:hypothetical protein J4437_00805 [Candidatus Woesearchaeota archaeon]|nr:hypothetical protein [Candidatus Woesearchaeota archaeon]